MLPNKCTYLVVAMTDLVQPAAERGSVRPSLFLLHCGIRERRFIAKPLQAEPGGIWGVYVVHLRLYGGVL